MPSCHVRFLLHLLCASLVVLIPFSAAAAAPGYPAARGRVLVQLRAPAAGGGAEAPWLRLRNDLAARWQWKGVQFRRLVQPAIGRRPADKIAGLTAVAFDPERIDRDRLLAELAADPDILYAEPDYLLYKSTDDPYFPEQWALDNSGQVGGLPDADIDAPEGWQAAGGSVPVTVAVVDTGVDPTHEDLAGRLLPGYDFIHGRAGAADDEGHGTHVAGLIAAVADNGTGIAGIATNARILPVKVLDQSGAGYTSDIISGIEYATAQGAKIINLSLGMPAYSQALADAVAAARGAGVLLIAAAGNDGSGEPFYPAALSGVLAVGATDTFDRRTTFSNFGSHLALVAPGEELISTYPGNRYRALSGTSMASPVVAGGAALAWGIDPSLPAATLHDFLLQTADDQIGLAAEDTPGWDRYYGWGRLNLYRLVMAVQAGRGQLAETFESGSLRQLPWLVDEGDWRAVYTARHSGVFAAATNAAAAPGERADLQISTVCRDGSLGFWLRLDSPTTLDRLELWVDEELAAVYAPAAAWTYQSLPVTAGSHLFRWRFVKGGGQVDGGRAWLDDISFPVPFFPTTPNVFSVALTNKPRPVWNWASRNGASEFRYRLDAAEWSTTASLTFAPVADLPDGPHVLAVQEMGAEGAWSAAGYAAVLVDTEPPAPPHVVAPSLTTDPRPTWTWSSGGGGDGTFRYRLQAGSDWSYTARTSYTPRIGLREGVYTLQVQEQDAAGNWSEIGAATAEITAEIRLLAPQAGEILRPGDVLTVQWLPVPDISRYVLEYSTDGRKWKKIARLSGGAIYRWTVPLLRTGSDSLRLRVSAWRGPHLHSRDVSAALTLAGGVELESPARGEALVGGTSVDLLWRIDPLAPAPRSLEVKYALAGSSVWKTIARLRVDPLQPLPTSVAWTPPPVAAPVDCRLKVVLTAAARTFVDSETFSLRP